MRNDKNVQCVQDTKNLINKSYNIREQVLLALNQCKSHLENQEDQKSKRCYKKISWLIEKLNNYQLFLCGTNTKSILDTNVVWNRVDRAEELYDQVNTPKNRALQNIYRLFNISMMENNKAYMDFLGIQTIFLDPMYYKKFKNLTYLELVTEYSNGNSYK